MNSKAQMMVPISEADKDFSRVMHMADNYVHIVILKDNKPKYLLIDLVRTPLHEITSTGGIEQRFR